ncbi:MAG: hypothetical protein KBD83_05170 [Gammaproteobacteria bacterium]|nr:hypothetical protein [Gammaproteobacteria bacterium]
MPREQLINELATLQAALSEKEAALAEASTAAGETLSIYQCPITQDVIKDPVMLEGRPFERSALLQHIRYRLDQGLPITDPVTNLALNRPIDISQLSSCIFYKQALEQNFPVIAKLLSEIQKLEQEIAAIEAQLETLDATETPSIFPTTAVTTLDPTTDRYPAAAALLTHFQPRRHDNSNLAPTVKIILIGHTEAKKSQLLDAYFGTRDPSFFDIDFRRGSIELEDHSTVTIQCQDTAGQERFLNIALSSVHRNDAIFFIYNPYNENSLNYVREVLSTNLWMTQGDSIAHLVAYIPNNEHYTGDYAAFGATLAAEHSIPHYVIHSNELDPTAARNALAVLFNSTAHQVLSNRQANAAQSPEAPRGQQPGRCSIM